MPLFGPKTQRSHRASRLSAIGASHKTVSRFWAALKDRRVLARLCLVLMAVALLTVVVEGWKNPFRFRYGDRPAHGVLATVDFQRVDRRETERRRDEAESRVPLTFRRQPLPLDQLRNQLKSDFQEVSTAMSINDVAERVRRGFGLYLTRDDVDDPKQQAAVEALFQSLRRALTANDAGSGLLDDQQRLQRREGLLAEFARLAHVIDKRGLIDDDDVEKLGIQAGKRLLLLPENASDEQTIVSMVDVELKSQMEPGGPIAAQWESLPLLSRVRPQMESWLYRRVPATLRFDRPATQEALRAARRNVDEVFDDWYTEQVLMGPGERIRDSDLELLRDEYTAAESRVTVPQRLIRFGSSFLMIALLAVINGYYFVRNELKLVRSFGRLMSYLATVIIAVAIGRWLASYPMHAELIAVVVSAMILAVAYNQVLAALTAVSISLILALSTVGDLSHFVILISVSMTAVIPLTQVSSRLALIKVGFMTGVTYLLAFCGMEVISGHALEFQWSEHEILLEGLKGAGWCLVASYIVAGSLPIIESAFGVVTDVRLLELSDISHPLLQELVRRAPGTYTHSISVATIAEAAAESIGANGLLVRVGAYYHDIGKMLKPEYFVENMTEGMISRHDNLAPAMSTLIIIGHVKDGADLARQHHIPLSLIDFIEQHHGTTLVQYFFDSATRNAGDDPDHSCDVQESNFRYPGPKPQTREAGVLMLSDAVESATRTLSDPAPKRIETLVHKLTMDRLLDGQFEESSLTLSEIRLIEESLTKSMIAIYHGRIKYPEQRSA